MIRDSKTSFGGFRPPELSLDQLRASLNEAKRRRNRIMAFKWTKSSIEFATEFMNEIRLDDPKQMALTIFKYGFLITIPNKPELKVIIGDLLKKHHMIGLEEKNVPLSRLLSELT